jgi:uncharacterized protein YaaN involved in tellurite resistance
MEATLTKILGQVADDVVKKLTDHKKVKATDLAIFCAVQTSRDISSMKQTMESLDETIRDLSKTLGDLRVEIGVLRGGLR